MSDHAFRVYKSLRYIEENLFSQIDLDSIASAGAFSPFHFHRVFTSLLGVSVSEYVRKKRLGEAARRLLNSDQEILDLALECQYESQEAFTRAFKGIYEITPGQLRKVKKSIETDRPFTLDDLNKLIKGDAMQPRIETRKPMRIFGLARTYEQHNFEKSYKQWGEFSGRLGEMKECDQEIVMGIALSSHPDVPKSDKDKYIYMAAVEVSPNEKLPAGMVELNIPATTYAKFTHKGHVADYMMSTYRKIWNNWLPESDLKVLEAPEIEIYDTRFKLQSAESEFDVLIPIEQ